MRHPSWSSVATPIMGFSGIDDITTGIETMSIKRDLAAGL
jgi:hypothetical protein